MGSIPVLNFCKNVVKNPDKAILVYVGKKYGEFDLSGRKSMTTRFVTSNSTESSKKVGRCRART